MTGGARYPPRLGRGGGKLELTAAPRSPDRGYREFQKEAILMAYSARASPDGSPREVRRAKPRATIFLYTGRGCEHTGVFDDRTRVLPRFRYRHIPLHPHPPKIPPHMTLQRPLRIQYPLSSIIPHEYDPMPKRPAIFPVPFDREQCQIRQTVPRSKELFGRCRTQTILTQQTPHIGRLGP